MKNVTWNYLGGKGQERMIKNGWRLELANNWDEQVNPDALYERLMNEGWGQIKVYWGTTMIRGLHKAFAMVK